MKNLSKVLKLLRNYHNLSQIELADKLGISNSHLSEIESGKKTPSLKLLDKYDRFFELPGPAIPFFDYYLNDSNLCEIQRKKILVPNNILKILSWMQDITSTDRFNNETK
jgi:transcriptional regulator with XRE-family HTH domain